jgi:hypothetical protein
MKEDTENKVYTPVPEVAMCLFLTGQVPVLSVSDSIKALLGYSPQDFLTGRVSLKELIHPDDGDIAETLFLPDLHTISGSFNIRRNRASAAGADPW